MTFFKRKIQVFENLGNDYHVKYEITHGCGSILKNSLCPRFPCSGLKSTSFTIKDVATDTIEDDDFYDKPKDVNGDPIEELTPTPMNDF